MRKVPVPRRSEFARANEWPVKRYLRTQVIPWAVQRHFERLSHSCVLRYYRVRCAVPWPLQRELSKPVFVIGSSRSGTSMLTKVLGVSESLQYFSENDLVRGCMMSMVKRPEDRKALLDRLERTLIRLSGAAAGQRVLEKTPGHSLVSDTLAAHFIDAQFIHIVRDGRDCALSMQEHPWIKYELESNKPFWLRYVPQDFQDQWPALTKWQRGVIRWAVYVAGARKVKAIDANRYLELSYSKLCREPASSIEGVLSFLGIQKTPLIEKQIAAVDPGSLEQWRRAHLSDDDVAFYERVINHFGLQDIA